MILDAALRNIEFNSRAQKSKRIRADALSPPAATPPGGQPASQPASQLAGRR